MKDDEDSLHVMKLRGAIQLYGCTASAFGLLVMKGPYSHPDL
jgi:hypothetical protein